MISKPVGLFVRKEPNLPDNIIESLRLLGSRCCTRSIPKDKVFFMAGDKPDYCYFIVKGFVIGFDYSPDGDEQFYSFAIPDSVILEDCLLAGKPSLLSFRAVTETQVVCVDKPSLLTFMRKDSGFTIKLIESMSDKYHAALNQLADLKYYDAAHSFCNMLLVFADQYGKKENNRTIIKLRLNQSFLSKVIGVNRITITRTAKKLREMGLVDRVRGFYSFDEDKVRDYLGEAV